MNGILCVNKPQGYTSFDVVARIRGMSKTKKVGHSGTLDPMATGVLPVFIGSATKACDMLSNDDKEYVASFALGMTSDTLDSTGTILSKKQSDVNKDRLLSVLEGFKGEITQIPPMYSAVKVNGKRLYDLARQGKEVKREPRKITVYELELLSFDEDLQEGKLRISCSKGTYIRSIIDDVGKELGVGGIMTGLVRTKACGFSLADCASLEQIQEWTSNDELKEHLFATDSVFSHLPKIKLNSVQSFKFKNGVKLDLNRINYEKSEPMHRVYDDNACFMGVARANEETRELIIVKMF